VTDPFAVDGVDALYALDPSAFTQARDALAKERRGAGDRDAAAAIKALRRPTVVAAALNHVARDDPGSIDALAEAAAGVRDAQRRAVESGDSTVLRDATRAWRERIADVAAAVSARAGSQHRDAAAGMLEAASVDDELLARLRAGRLDREEQAPSGFEAAGLGGLTLIEGGGASPTSGAARAEARRRAVRLRTDLERAEAAFAKASERLERAEEHLADAQRAVGDAREAVDAAARERDDAAAALADAEADHRE
jgi:hypothetical protein